MCQLNPKNRRERVDVGMEMRYSCCTDEAVVSLREVIWEASGTLLKHSSCSINHASGVEWTDDSGFDYLSEM